MNSFLSTFALLSVIHHTLVSGYSSGPPSFKCESMQPGGPHGSPANNSGSPFRVTLSKNTYSPGETLTVTIESTNADKFVGFMLEARKVGETKPQGSFPDALPNRSKHMDCTSIGADAKGVVGHQNPSGVSQVKWSSLQFKWTAPNPAVGDIRLRATVVKEKTVYYLGLESSNISAVPAPTVAVSPTAVLPSASVSQTTKAPSSSELYSSTCGKTKGCLLHPDSCTSSNNCDYAVTFSSDDSQVTFELSGKASGWVAVGFDDDGKMPEGDVLACVQRSGSVLLEHYINNGYTPVKSAKAEGATLLSSSFSDGIIKCRFTRLKKTADSDTRDLDSPWYLFAGYGKIDSSKIAYHKWRLASTQKVDFSKMYLVSGEDKGLALLKVHACLMIIAWLGCSGTGIIFARYLRNVWGDLLGLKLWFQVHRAVMMTAVVLSIAGVVCAFVHVQAWSPGLHPILGIIVVSLATLQPLIAFFRPHPGEENRVIFNWVHRSVAVVAFLLSMASVFSGLKQQALDPGSGAVYTFIVFIAVFVVLCIALEVFSYRQKTKHNSAIISKGNPHQDDHANQFSNKMTIERTPEHDNHSIQKGALVIFLLVMLAVVITLVVLVAKKGSGEDHDHAQDH